MPVEAKPLFRPDVVRPYVETFQIPPRVEALRPKLAEWAELIRSGRADDLKETQLLPAFLSEIFGELLGYTEPRSGASYTLTREQLVEVGGKFADAVIGRFTPESRRYRARTDTHPCSPSSGSAAPVGTRPPSLSCLPPPSGDCQPRPAYPPAR